MHAQMVEGADVHIQPGEISVWGGKLWVRMTVTNAGGGVVTVDRDAITAHLKSGTTINRAIGTWTQHAPYAIGPGATHPVFVEFKEDGFSWLDVGEVGIDMSKAITRGGKPVNIAPLIVMR